MEYVQNYDKRMQEMMEENRRLKKVPTLLLHSCCAPCSSAVLERLAQDFRITVFYFNPNIEPREEYAKRVEELNRLLEQMPLGQPVSLLEGGYEPERFYQAVQGQENSGEGGGRCYACYELRLQETAKMANERGFDYFTTTLSISPYKNAKWLNEIGSRMAKTGTAAYLYSDFKKRDGYRRSIALSAEYGLYRQDYCGCRFSKQEREQQKREKS